MPQVIVQRNDNGSPIVLPQAMKPTTSGSASRPA